MAEPNDYRDAADAIVSLVRMHREVLENTGDADKLADIAEGLADEAREMEKDQE